MKNLVTECEDQNLIKGKALKLKHNIIKQKFTEGKNTYVVYNVNNIMSQSLEDEDFFITKLAQTIKTFIGAAKKVLVVGLGNRHIIADSFGTSCLKRVIATRGLVKTNCEVSAISPSVFGLTGIESADVIKSVVNIVKPQVVIIIDTLCANTYENLVTNFQISNAGFEPGSGVGNKRKSVNLKTVNTKVVSIGVPFVVYAKSFIKSAISTTMQTTIQTNKKHNNLGIYNELLKLNFNNLILTVKDVDESIKKCSYVVSSAINLALNNYSLTEQELILGK